MFLGTGRWISPNTLDVSIYVHMTDLHKISVDERSYDDDSCQTKKALHCFQIAYVVLRTEIPSLKPDLATAKYCTCS